jgi:septal ring factor EnvC (AmiA/AmiB activator)
MLPASSVNEYLRQGTPATPNDDDNHRAGFDEAGNRVGPEDKAKAVKWLYNRPLRDYAYLFTEYARERAQMFAQIAGLKEDNARLDVAQQSALKLKAHREQEITALSADLKMMVRDRTTIEQLLNTIKGQLANATRERGELLQKSAASAEKLVTSQLAQLRAITDATAPAAALPAPVNPRAGAAGPR